MLLALLRSPVCFLLPCSCAGRADRRSSSGRFRTRRCARPPLAPPRSCRASASPSCPHLRWARFQASPPAAACDPVFLSRTRPRSQYAADSLSPRTPAPATLPYSLPYIPLPNRRASAAHPPPRLQSSPAPSGLSCSRWDSRFPASAAPARHCAEPPCAGPAMKCFRSTQEYPATARPSPSSLSRPLAAASPQLPDLLHVVPSVHPVKSSPLPSRQRTQNRVIQHFRALPQASFALGDHPVHIGDPRRDLRPQLVRRHPPRASPLRSLAPRRQVSQPRHRHDPHALLPGRHTGQRLVRLQAPAHALHRARIGQTQMLEHFRRAPLSRRMPL